MSAQQMDGPFERFASWEQTRHEYARAWKERTGGKVLGYFCTYVPEEILYAANVLPVRIYGSHEPEDVTNRHIFPMFCPYSRDTLAQGLKGKYSYLDGVMISQSCLHMRQTYNSWTKHVPAEFSYYLPMPMKVHSPFAVDYLTEELVQFKKAVEGWVGKEITNNQLKEGIGIMNENRRLLHKVYDFRKNDDPKMTGEEALEVVFSSQLTDKREHNQAMGKLLDQVQNRKLERDPGLRLMMITSEFDDIPFIHMIESLGATVVTDEHCTGTRYFWNTVEDGGNPLQSIAKRYVERPPCPTKDWEVRQRIPHILSLAKEFNVKGAILAQQKFCDPHEFDIPIVGEKLKASGIPSLVLEFDITNPVGPFKTRVEAFIEMLSQESLF